MNRLLLRTLLVAAGLAAFSYLAWGQSWVNSGVSTGVSYPVGGQPVNGSQTLSGAATSGAAVATLPAQAGRWTYICGFTITSGNFTAGAMVTAVIANLQGGNLSYAYLQPQTGQGAFGVTFAPVCLPTNAANTAITVTVPGNASTAGLTAVNAWGYQF
jgi:hypothetical protein